MGMEEFREKVKGMSPEEAKKLLKELLKEISPKRGARKEVPEEAKRLIDEYFQLKARLIEIRRELKEKYGLTPTGTTVRKGYGEYDYTGTPAYNAVAEIIKGAGRITREELEKELNARGYRWSGTINVVLKNLREQGKVAKSGGEYVWIGE